MIICLVAILTWIIPAGLITLIKLAILLRAYHKSVTANPQGIWDVFMAPIYGMIGNDQTEGAISISLFILVIGGFLGVVNKTKALDDGIGAVVRKYKGK